MLSALEPGEYNLSVTSAGFKTSEKTGLNLTAAERLSARSIVLQVGQLTDSVTVKADAAVVQTASSEKSGVLTSTQVENLLIKGRNVITMATAARRGGYQRPGCSGQELRDRTLGERQPA